MTTLEDHDLFTPTPATSNGDNRRTCRRHDWTHIAPDGTVCTDYCSRCGRFRDETRSRRGRSSLRAGKDAERAIAKAYGGTRTGQFGGPDDVIVGELFVVQSKAGRTWFSQRVVDELDKLPRTGGRVPTLVVSNRPGPGHRTRRYVVRLLEDDVALHGERP